MAKRAASGDKDRRRLQHVNPWPKEEESPYPSNAEISFRRMSKSDREWQDLLEADPKLRLAWNRYQNNES